MNAVGIDISKGKSMLAALRPFGEVAIAPREYPHTGEELGRMVSDILALGEDTRVVMEATGRYHEVVASTLYEHGLFVCVLNPLLVKQSGGGSLRKAKTDKKDALKIAKYCLDNWADLREYAPLDAVRQQLKLFSRQYNLYMKTIVSLQNNLISLADKVFPGVNELFKSPGKDDGHQKWVDFFHTFWHADCIANVSEKSFTDRYQKWCKRKGYHFSREKAEDLYIESAGLILTLPKNESTKMLVQTAAQEMIDARATLAAFRDEMIRLAKLLPEYETVLSMYGVGEITGAQLMAEIGDVTRFPHRSSLIAFAGIDPDVDQYGKHDASSVPTSKRGSPHLRKTLFQIVSTYLKHSPMDEPVYQFLDKKRSEGKPFYVYMTAAANKFLRIYYARVKEVLSMEEESANEPA